MIILLKASILKFQTMAKEYLMLTSQGFLDPMNNMSILIQNYHNQALGLG